MPKLLYLSTYVVFHIFLLMDKWICHMCLFWISVSAILLTLTSYSVFDTLSFGCGLWLTKYHEWRFIFLDGIWGTWTWILGLVRRHNNKVHKVDWDGYGAEGNTQRVAGCNNGENIKDNPKSEKKDHTRSFRRSTKPWSLDTIVGAETLGLLSFHGGELSAKHNKFKTNISEKWATYLSRKYKKRNKIAWYNNV